MEPVADDFTGEDNCVLAEREVREPHGLGRCPGLVQGVRENAVLAVLQRQVNGVPTADEYLETACHRASVDRSGRRLRGTARADPPLDRIRPPAALRRGRAMRPGSARTAAVSSRADDNCATTARARIARAVGGGIRAENRPATIPAGRRCCQRPRVAGWAGFPPRAGAPGGRVYTVWSGSSTDAGEGSPRCPKDHPETSASRPRHSIPPGGRGLTPEASTRASLR